MDMQIMLGILFTLLNKGKESARSFANRYGVSTRTIYRYVDELTCANVPVTMTRGAQGGISISDAFKLPRGFLTQEEYAETMSAVAAMLGETDSPALRSALDKLGAQVKAERKDLSLSGNILVDSGTWGDEQKFRDRLTLANRCVEERLELEIDYVDRTGERTRRTVLPHLLVYKQAVWYVYAYCLLRGKFRLFKLGRMRAMNVTGKTFERRPFSRDDIPLSLWQSADVVEATFSVSKKALPLVEEWLGVDNVHKRDGGFYAEAVLPDDEMLVGKILSVGAGFRVLSPASLRERVAREAERLAAVYRTP